jgi:hypothetical protein
MTLVVMAVAVLVAGYLVWTLGARTTVGDASIGSPAPATSATGVQPAGTAPASSAGGALMGAPATSQEARVPPGSAGPPAGTVGAKP